PGLSGGPCLRLPGAADRRDGGEVLGHGRPRVASVGRAEYLTGLRPEVQAERVFSVVTERLTKDGEEGAVRGESLAELRPRLASVAGTVDADPPIGRHPIEVAAKRDDEGPVRVVGVCHQRESEVRGDPALRPDVHPALPGVVGAIYTSVELHVERGRL